MSLRTPVSFFVVSIISAVAAYPMPLHRGAGSGEHHFVTPANRILGVSIRHIRAYPFDERPPVRIVRFVHPGGPAFGVLSDDEGAPQVAEIEGHPFGALTPTGALWPLADVRLLSPILPSKVVGIGRNYASHAAEMTSAEPAPVPPIFLKPSTAVIGPGDAIRLPVDVERVDHEAELAVVIGATGARRLTPAQAEAAILGYTCANDVTARDHQRVDGQWARAKGHDSFCPLGPWIDTAFRPASQELRCEVDGELRQRGSLDEMTHSIADLISYVSGVMTLLPGDVLLTGTPAGVAPLRAGNSVSITVEGLGTLTNPVIAAG
jgi:2-keto-4-pentenoate hydratase/2-oxohepta-3-ene-1,7-dioic acid hydratase in catechol pathway